MPFGDTPPGARGGFQGPFGTPVVGPYAGEKGLSFGEDNTFNVGEDQEVRVLDAEGNVIFSGSGVEGAKRAVAVGQSLSNDLGKNANFKIQTGERTINTDGSVGGTRYIDVAYAAPRQTGLGFLADNVLPFAASFIPGIGPIAGAALGSALSSGLQGRSLQDALVRAAIAGGSAYAGGQLLGPATPAASSSVTGGNIASAAIPAGSFDGILVNATRAAAPSLVGSAVGGALGSGLSGVTGSNPPSQNLAQQTPADLYAGIEPIDVLATRFASGSGAPFGAAFPIPVSAMLSGELNAAQPTPAEQPATATPEEIVVTAPKSYLSPESLAGIMATFGGGILPPAQSFPQQPTPTPQPETVQPVVEEPGTIVTGMESYNPTELLAILGGAGALATAAATAGGGAGASSNVVNGVDQASGDIVVSGSVPGAAPIPAVIAGLGGIPAITQGALTAAQTAGTPPSDKSGFLGTGLTIPQLLSIGGVGADLLKSLLAGGGGDTGAGVPYVSPFGTGAGFAPRQDMRANPNIIDYERYGFGPEAMFFKPQYTGLLPANAPAPQAPAGMSINPALMPLF